MITKVIIAATLLVAFATLPHSQLDLTGCEDALPLTRHGTSASDGSTGPTFPFYCPQGATI